MTEALSGRAWRIGFKREAAANDVVLLRFADPEGNVAVLRDESDPAAIDDFVVSLDALDETAESAALRVAARGLKVTWMPERATIACDDNPTAAMLGIVEFTYYERQLRRLEQEIADAWGELEEDNGLAFDVNPKGLARSTVVGERMEQTLRRRMQLARLEGHFYAPFAELSGPARKLGEGLREEADMEGRAEVLSGQIEVFEGIYEMAAQRIGEYRAARQGHIMELVIIVLLALEALLMAAEAVLRR